MQEEAERMLLFASTEIIIPDLKRIGRQLDSELSQNGAHHKQDFNIKNLI